MQISLTNTLTRRKEVFAPADPGRVTLYVCGPTVYNYAHIGNARPPVVFDVLFRLLRRAYGENAVIYARNFTDIDDKIIDAAKSAGLPIGVITDKFARLYEADMAALGVLAPTFAPCATDHIDDMIALIEKLIAGGAAYQVSSGVYFSVAAAAEYGKLSRRTQDELKAGARVEGEDDKRHPSDFALWKRAKPGEPFWDSPFGQGRPGWHIECSAMIEAQLGGTIDIHGGGIDLVFPHHENEIAQSETAHGRPLARLWMHNGFLTMAGGKMSKSIGNIVTVRELLEQGWQGETIRWALLSAHYRAPLDWSEDLLKQAQATLDSLYQLLRDADEFLAEFGVTASREAVENVRDQIFLPQLCDDLNTSGFLSKLAFQQKMIRGSLEVAKHYPDRIDPEIQTPADTAQNIANGVGVLRSAGELLGVLQIAPIAWFVSGVDAAAEIDALVAERVAARAAKNFAEADRLRVVLADMGVEVMDNPAGSTWRRKS